MVYWRRARAAVRPVTVGATGRGVAKTTLDEQGATLMPYTLAICAPLSRLALHSQASCSCPSSPPHGNRVDLSRLDLDVG